MRETYEQRVRRLAEQFQRERERRAGLSPAERSAEAAFWHAPPPERGWVPFPPEWVQPEVGGLRFQGLPVSGEPGDKPVQWHHSEGGYLSDLHVDNQPVTRTCTSSATMEALFERLTPAPDAPAPRLELVREVQDRLNSGLSELEEGVTALTSLLLPPGHYMATLMQLRPRWVQPGDAHDFFAQEVRQFWGYPATLDNQLPYYRSPGWRQPSTVTYASGVTEAAPDLGVCVLIPTQPDEALRPERVAHYAQRMAEGERPTLLSLHVCEERGGNSSVVSRPTLGNLALSMHHVLDGHHKLRAAALGGHRIGVLAFTELGGSHRVSPSQDDEGKRWLHRRQALMARWHNLASAEAG